MGEGGRVEIVNYTAHRWSLVHQHSYQMNSWDFPQSVESGEKASGYVEWEQGWLTHESDDAGEARYRIDGTGYEFEVQARNTDGFVIQVRNISVPSGEWRYRSDEVQLGWYEDGTVSFTLPSSD